MSDDVLDEKKKKKQQKGKKRARKVAARIASRRSSFSSSDDLGSPKLAITSSNASLSSVARSPARLIIGMANS